LRFEGRQDRTGGTLTDVDTTLASPELFDTLGIPLRAGRAFTPADAADAPRVAVINEAFVRRYYRGGSPLGSRVALGSDQASPWITIVGVVGDTRGQGLLQPPREGIYFPVRQMDGDWNQLFLLVRTEGDPLAMVATVRREIMALDPDQPAYAIQTLQDAFAADVFVQRSLMTLLAIFAALALTLAAVGIYAVMSYAVAARTQEIGIRIALGAQRRSVVRMVVGQVVRLVLVGTAIGLAGALALGRVIASVLVGTEPSDPAAIVSVAILLAVVAVVAAYVPARRASRIDPVLALRSE
jgi:putative ABC transport system permease protein